MNAQAFPLDPQDQGMSSLNPPPDTGRDEEALVKAFLQAMPENESQRFMADNAHLTPEQFRAKVVATATNNAELAGLGGNQMTRGGSIMGNAIRNAPEGRKTRGGFTASNPLEFAGNLAQQYMGNQMYRKGLGEQKSAVAAQAEKQADPMLAALQRAQEQNRY